jgi:hypothetical protein
MLGHEQRRGGRGSGGGGGGRRARRMRARPSVVEQALCERERVRCVLVHARSVRVACSRGHELAVALPGARWRAQRRETRLRGSCRRSSSSSGRRRGARLTRRAREPPEVGGRGRRALRGRRGRRTPKALDEAAYRWLCWRRRGRHGRCGPLRPGDCEEGLQGREPMWWQARRAGCTGERGRESRTHRVAARSGGRGWTRDGGD